MFENLQPLTAAVVGSLIVIGWRTCWFQFKVTVHRILNPEVREAPVYKWAYCEYGDHKVRTEDMAWEDDDFICDSCVQDQECERQQR